LHHRSYDVATARLFEDPDQSHLSRADLATSAAHQLRRPRLKVLKRALAQAFGRGFVPLERGLARIQQLPNLAQPSFQVPRYISSQKANVLARCRSKRTNARLPATKYSRPPLIEEVTLEVPHSQNISKGSAISMAAGILRHSRPDLSKATKGSATTTPAARSGNQISCSNSNRSFRTMQRP
jgi:hypothetical protein